jgi:S-layer homology domain
VRRWTLALVASVAVGAGVATAVVQDVCGPFTDVSSTLCPYVLEMYYLGITAGTSPTTYSPEATVTRGQAAIFLSKGVNQAIARSSRRAALGQWWNQSSYLWHTRLALTPLSQDGALYYRTPVASDGKDLWVGRVSEVYRVRASDGRLLETWSLDAGGSALLTAMGRVFVGQVDGTGGASLSMINPSLPPGPATVVAPSREGYESNLVFDGERIWWSQSLETVTIVTPAPTAPWPETTVGGFQSAQSLVFDGVHMWLHDVGACALLRLDDSGSVLQTVDLGTSCSASSMVFDGSNILVTSSQGILAVRASDGAVVAHIPTVSDPYGLAFDGDRIFVLCDGFFQAPDSLVVLRASDYSTLASGPFNEGFGSLLLNSVASDGLNFWLTAQNADGFALARY